jgi:hypothetical protein
MTTPTEEKLIVQGPSRGGWVTEPGSIQETREYVERKARERTTLGRVERKCLNCGKDWVDPRCECGSFEFSERELRPSAMTITGQGITAVEEPPKVKVSATPMDLFALRSLKSTLIDLEHRLVDADAAARRLVNVNVTGVEVFGHLQSVLNSLTTPGDFQLRADAPLTSISLVPVLRALVAEIDRTLNRYEEEKNSK